MSYPYGPNRKPGMFRDVWEAMLLAGVVLLCAFVLIALAWVAAQ